MPTYLRLVNILAMATPQQQIRHRLTGGWIAPSGRVATVLVSRADGQVTEQLAHVRMADGPRVRDMRPLVKRAAAG